MSRSNQTKLAITVLTVLMACGSVAYAEELGDDTKYILASAHNSGVNNTMWVTDLRIFNPDAAETIEVAVAFLPAGVDNSAVSEQTITVLPRQAAALDDVVASVFGDARAGAIRLHSDDDFLATSRTYNIGDGLSGTFGQYIAAVRAEDALEQGILIQLANQPGPNGFRTNVGFVNPTMTTAGVTISVYDVDSAVLIGSGTIELLPLGFRQVNDVFAFVGAGESSVPNASVEIAADPTVLAYASVVDNTSGDPIFAGAWPDNGTPGTANNAPTGTISSPSGDVTINVGGTVSFSGTASDPDDDDTTVLWDFGDGMTSSELSPGDHTFNDLGIYLVTFTATDDNGLDDPTPDSRTITVEGDNNPPNGVITEPSGDVTITAGQAVSFSGTASDPDDDQITVLWNFGDGMTSTELAPGDHIFSAPGSYQVTFTATDDLGLADPTPDSRTITVEGENNPPDGVITQPSGDVTITAGEAVFFVGAASDLDGDPVSVLWNFGDGATSTILTPGNHTYAAPGSYPVTFTATDDLGLADPTPDSRTITVVSQNNPPDGVITEPVGNVTITAGQSVAFAGSISDPDGDQVTVLWNFGDGITSALLIPSDHTYSSPGTFTVTFTATDDQGLPDPTPDSRTITVNPAAPTLSQVQSTIFTPSCIGCHGGGSPEAGLNLEDGQSYSNLVNVPATTTSGIRVVPNQPNSSVLVTELEDGHRNLAQTAIQMIRDWISAGAEDN